MDRTSMRVADNFGNIWSACGQQESPYVERKMNNYTCNDLYNATCGFVRTSSAINKKRKKFIKIQMSHKNGVLLFFFCKFLNMN